MNPATDLPEGADLEMAETGQAILDAPICPSCGTPYRLHQVKNPKGWDAGLLSNGLLVPNGRAPPYMMVWFHGDGLRTSCGGPSKLSEDGLTEVYLKEDSGSS
jgi:hypothetical protein